MRFRIRKHDSGRVVWLVFWTGLLVIATSVAPMPLPELHEGEVYLLSAVPVCSWVVSQVLFVCAILLYFFETVPKSG